MGFELKRKTQNKFFKVIYSLFMEIYLKFILPVLIK